GIRYDCQRLLAELESRAEIACLFAHAGKRLQIEAPGDEFQDRRGVIGGLVDEAALGVGRDDQRRYSRAGPEAIAPARSVRRRYVVPESSVLIVRDDDRHVVPLWASAQAVEHVVDVGIAADE